MQRSLQRIGGTPGNLTGLDRLNLRASNRPYDGKIAGLYDLEETLGRGHFAVVKLARHVFTGEKVAVKVIDKSKLDEVSKAHLFQEVRCMKLVQHPNVVRLYEVIDTATKLYLILELGDGGDLYEYIIRHDTGLPDEMAKEYFRQIVRAISYCHQLHVVHRDLKPENVVFFKKLGIVKLTDFGFSNKFYPGQKLETSCGSLAYSAPEILLGDSYDAPAVDVWSLGVILYMLVCGQPPFQEANDSETLTMIMDCKYSVPIHVSNECKDLIARMLVRNPENRATLKEISNHPWLRSEKEETELTLPLVSREQLCEDDHNFIVQKIVNGNIATKEEIQESLDKNEYNHITATYYLLAERKLRSKRVDLVSKTKRPENLPVGKHLSLQNRDDNGSAESPVCLLNVPRTPGDLPQRNRKCSIVQEDEEEEELSSCSGREELGPPLNRRGSRSEGRLNLALQERLSDSESRRIPNLSDKIGAPNSPKLTKDPSPHRPNTTGGRVKEQQTKWGSIKSASLCEPPKGEDQVVPTTIITDSSTITIPIITTSVPVDCSAPKYKTMPSPTRTLSNNLNEIFEEGAESTETHRPSSRQFVKRTPYEQRRSKFHKTRTASCSSSDASDDDSEKRKKRAHKLNPSAKPFQGRRDSYDDSSDSQEPGTGCGGGGEGRHTVSGSSRASVEQNSGGDGGTSNQDGNKGNDTSGGRKNTGNTAMLGRRHKASRRRNGETRLRESQSLNRITEVQEDTSHHIVISTTVVGTQGPLTPKVKSLGARILQSFNNMSSGSSKKHQQSNQNDEKYGISNTEYNSTSSTPDEDKEERNKRDSWHSHVSRKDTLTKDRDKSSTTEKDKENKQVTEKKKLKILGKYFQMHKKLFIPIPVIFNKSSRLYKAQSCGSLARDKINKSDTLKCRQRAVSVFRNSLNEEDINRNQKDKARRKSTTVVHLNNVCNELTGMCAIHLGQTSKCSFC